MEKRVDSSFFGCGNRACFWMFILFSKQKYASHTFHESPENVCFQLIVCLLRQCVGCMQYYRCKFKIIKVLDRYSYYHGLGGVERQISQL